MMRLPLTQLEGRGDGSDHCRLAGILYVLDLKTRADDSDTNTARQSIIEVLFIRINHLPSPILHLASFSQDLSHYLD